MVKLKTRLKRIMAVVLSAALLTTGADVSVFAEEKASGIEAYSLIPVEIPDAEESVYTDTLITPVSDRTVTGIFCNSAFPEQYDAREEGIVTEARDQGESELCWAFASASVLETNAVKNGYMEGDTYLSPDTMGYYFYNRVPDILNNTNSVKVTRKRSGRIDYFDNGGMVLNNALSLMQWMTPLYESDGEFKGESREYPKTTEYAYDKDAVHVQQVRWVSSADKNAVKSLVMEYGSAAVNLYMSKFGVNTVSFNSVSSNTVSSNEVRFFTLYNDDEVSVSHAVTVIGWDDSFPKEYFKGAQKRTMPRSDGAFIVKNSYKEAPYVYVSYEDLSIAGSENNNKAVAMGVSPADKYDHNYGYDGGVGTHTAAANGTIYAANVFKAKGNSDEKGAEEIRAVAFATNTPNVNYTIKIYTDVNNRGGDPTNGLLQMTLKSDKPLSQAGYYTVELPQSVYVDEDAYFSVVVALTGENRSLQTTFMYDDLYGGGVKDWVTSNPNPSTGRSYLSKDGTTWTDSAETINKEYADKVNGTVPKIGYVRIKAYSSDVNASGEFYIDNDCVSDIPDQVFTGEQITPDPVIYHGNTRLVKNRDYSVVYGSNKTAGKRRGTVTITGKGKYLTKTSIVRTFNIVKKDIASLDLQILGLEEQLYTGKEIKPVKIICRDVELREGADYKIKYSKNVKPGVAKVTIKGKGNYTGTVKSTFMIGKRDISDEGIDVKSINPVSYKGELQFPRVTIMSKFASRSVLKQGRDYSLEYVDNLLPGDASVIINGRGYYTGSRRVNFVIQGANLEEAVIEKIPDQIYTGYDIIPDVKINYKGKELKESVDIDISYFDNHNVGMATALITGRKGTIYFGTQIKANYMIKPANLSNVTLENFGDVTYTAGKRYYTQNEDAASDSRMKLRLPSGYYLNPKDYKVSYEDNYSTGSQVKATMTITADGNNVTGSLKKEFNIYVGTKVCLSDYTNNKLKLTGFSQSREYIFDSSDHRESADNSIKPAINISYKEAILTEGTDYTIEYFDNKEIGRGYLVITAAEGSNYVGQRVEYFEIIGKPIFVTSLGVADNDFKVTEPKDCVYNGAPQTPEIEISEHILRDKNKYSKKRESYMKLKEGKDYTLKWIKNVDAGRASVKLTGIGEYSGEHTFYFNIESADMSTVLHDKVPAQNYSGKQICPDLYIANKGRYLMEGVDYIRTYGENINAGTGTITYTPVPLTQAEINAGMIPNYVGELTVEFKIKPMKLNNSAIKVSMLSGLEFNGQKLMPEALLYISVDGEYQLIPESDYLVSYGKNSAPGTGTIIFKAAGTSHGSVGNISGSLKHKFVIDGSYISVSANEIESVAKCEYTGKKSKLSIPIISSANGDMVEKRDFIIKTDGRKDAGTGIFRIIGRGDYKGNIKALSYTVVPKAVNTDDIEVKGVSDVTMGNYKGKVRFPKLSVKVKKGKKLKLGKDYVVSYLNNEAQGKATMVINLVNNYSGSRIVEFNIE